VNTTEARAPSGAARAFLPAVVRWFDSWAVDPRDAQLDPRGTDWARVVPFVVLHLACLLVFVVGWSWIAVAVAAAFYAVRMFAVTGFYHRYFSHRSFKTSRVMQFLFALLGASAVQRGPLWWASHHRDHHRHSDEEGDVHSPVQDTFWWSHVGWITARANYRTKVELVKDLVRFPELRFLDRFDALVPLAVLGGMFGLGALLQALWPQLGTGPLQMAVWGFVISTIVLHHATFSINSLAHRIGSRRYSTGDASRNNLLLALVTLGEGWHNNHHHYQASVRQGHRWWEIDVTYYVLWTMARLGLVWDLKPVPVHVMERGRLR
jgi:stearoyl-CoA desaturase (delta-9 desaturase)